MELRFVSARIKKGLVAGDALSYFLAYGRVGDDLFVVDAGGPTGRFGADQVRRFAQGLTPRGSYAGRAPTDAELPQEMAGRGSPLGEEEDPSIAIREQVMRFLPPS